MADWFKFYENDLEETRLQYAISKLPEVVSVWVRTLSECCRHKSDTFRWGSNIEVFGFSHSLGLTPEKVEQGFKLLAEIDYIEKGENFIKVLKWNNKQSEYCQWKRRHDNRSPDSVRTPSGVSSRRGEERRGDKKRVIADSPAPASESPNHVAFVNGWCENFEKQFESKYDFQGGKDGAAVKKILKLNILVVDLLEIAKKAWDNVAITRYRSAASIHGFFTNFNQIQAELKNGTKTHQSNPPQRVDRSIGTANEGTAAQYRGLGRVAKIRDVG